MNKYDELLDRAKMFYDQPMVGELMNAVRELKERPEVVRCEGCYYFRNFLCKHPQWGKDNDFLHPMVSEDDYCSYGERKEDE